MWGSKEYREENSANYVTCPKCFHNKTAGRANKNGVIAIRVSLSGILVQHAIQERK